LRKRTYAALAISAGVLVWLGVDLFGGRRSDLREFDPDAVARLETDMWRAYYDRKQVRLFLQLAELLRTQYNAPFARSFTMAFYGAKSAFIFKGGSKRSDYEKALPDLDRFYSALHRMSAAPFDEHKPARLELEWWIIHRERQHHSREDLDHSLANLQAAVYGLPAERFERHARLRAEAMLLRDDKWESGGVSETDWTTIHDLLLQSWRDLWMQVRGAHT